MLDSNDPLKAREIMQRKEDGRVLCDGGLRVGLERLIGCERANHLKKLVEIEAAKRRLSGGLLSGEEGDGGA